MFIKRAEEGGFINERREKANRIAGYTTAVMIEALFIARVVLVFAALSVNGISVFGYRLFIRKRCAWMLL